MEIDREAWKLAHRLAAARRQACIDATSGLGFNPNRPTRTNGA